MPEIKIMVAQAVRILAILGFGVQMGIQAQAESLFNFEFSGNQTFGNIVFDQSVPDANPDPQKGLYPDAIVSYVIHVNGTRATETYVPTYLTLQGTFGDVVVGINAEGIGACGPEDCFSFDLNAHFLKLGPEDFDLTFYYPINSLPSDGLPTAVPATGPGILRGEVQFFLGLAASTKVSPVPEALPLLQLGLGLAIFALIGHGTKRKRIALNQRGG